MTTNVNWLEHIQHKSAALCFSCLFSIIFLTIEEILEEDGKGNTNTIIMGDWK